MKVQVLASGLSVMLAVAAAGCGDGDKTITNPPDTNSGVADSGVTDSGVADAGSTTPDTAGPTDLGNLPDAGPTAQDTGSGDAAVEDIGPMDEAFCVAGYAFCNGNTLFTCAADGSTYGTETCPDGCSNGACFSDCVAGQAKCLGAHILGICQADGSFKQKTCPGVCKNGKCSSDQQLCEPTSLFCDPTGKKVLQCGQDGLSASDYKMCPFGCDAEKKTCKDPVCEPGKKQCMASEEKSIESCDENGMGWTKVQECKTGCEYGACLEPACSEGELKCSVTHTKLFECAPDLLSFDTKENCQWGCLSPEAKPAMCALCPQDGLSCDLYDITECKDPLVGFEPIDYCDYPLTCAAGQCIDVIIVAEGEKSAAMLQLMNAFLGCWNAGKDGVCMGLNTLNVTYDITEEDFYNWICQDEGALQAQFASEGDYLTAKDILGCGLFDQDDFIVKTGAVHGNQDGVECYAFSSAGGVIGNNKLITVDTCENFILLAQ